MEILTIVFVLIVLAIITIYRGSRKENLVTYTSRDERRQRLVNSVPEDRRRAVARQIASNWPPMDRDACPDWLYAPSANDMYRDSHAADSLARFEATAHGQ
jgi:hypothetical protein